MNVKETNCSLQWWQNMNQCSLQWVFLFVKYQVLWGHKQKDTNVRKYQLQSKNLDKLMFANKNCRNDSKAGCRGSSNLVKFVEMNVNLEKQLKFFEK